ncbi:MAG: polysaccharide biosynthesis tyrosine autokinase [Elusimicrobia bacterium]|nr:polysaccharide biosynthesis tyrosine autokinase [Elusimicrobiota bacterium]
MTERIHNELTLYDYWQIIKKRRIIAIGVFLLIVFSVLVFTFLSTEIYRASTTVELRIEGPSFWAMGTMGQEISWMIDVDTEMRKVESYPVLLHTAKLLGQVDENTSDARKEQIVNVLRGKVSVSKVANTTLMNIIATDTDPKKTVEIANAAGKAYVDETIEGRNERARKTREFIEKQVTVLSDELKEKEQQIRQYVASGLITEKVQSMGGSLTDLLVERSNLLTQYGNKHPEVIKINSKINVLKSKLGKMSGSELEYVILLRDVKIDEGLYEMLIRKHKEALITEADKVIPVAIVEPANNAVLVKPNKQLNVLMGIIAGLIFAVIGVVLAENLDTSLRTAEEIEIYLKLPALAEIPHIKEEKTSPVPFSLLHDINSPYIEAYNEFLVNFSDDREKKVQTILFTSVMPSEGKTEVTSNFAITQSQHDNKTLIVDADFRQAAIHKLFKIPRKPGLMDVLKDKLNWRSVLAKPKIDSASNLSLDNVRILSVGHLPAHPMRVLNSPEFSNLITELRNEFDYILFDSPPLYYFADPAVLSSLSDGIIIVHTPGMANRNELMRIRNRLSTKIIGVVLNNMEEKRRGYYYYKYYSGSKKKKLSLAEKILRRLG